MFHVLLQSGNVLCQGQGFSCFRVCYSRFEIIIIVIAYHVPETLFQDILYRSLYSNFRLWLLYYFWSINITFSCLLHINLICVFYGHCICTHGYLFCVMGSILTMVVIAHVFVIMVYFFLPMFWVSNLYKAYLPCISFFGLSRCRWPYMWSAI